MENDSDSKNDIKMTDDDEDVLHIDAFTKLMKAAQIPVILKVTRHHFYVVLSFPHDKKGGVQSINVS